jgi:uncharacterized protein involved in exopolysaccharide biosynthesis
MNRLALCRNALASWERERSTLLDQRARLVAIYEATGQLGGQAQSALSDDERQLVALEAELASALAVLSETNPRVLTLQRRVDLLRESILTSRSTAAADLPEDTEQLDPNRFVLDLQLNELDGQIEAIGEEIAEAEADILRLEDAISRTPTNSITLNSLERDYENIRNQYDAAVQRLAEASTGERIELTSRGQRITLIEPANVPEEPYSPNRQLIVATGGAVGFGLAASLFVLLEVLNRSVRRPAEITRSLGIQPLATIPYIESTGRRLMRRFVQVSLLLLVLAGVPAALWAIDTYYLPLDQLADRIMRRLGIT